MPNRKATVKIRAKTDSLNKIEVAVLYHCCLTAISEKRYRIAYFSQKPGQKKKILRRKPEKE